MPFSDEQTTWLETAQNKQADFKDAADLAEQKRIALIEIMGKIDKIRPDLKKANNDLEVSFKDDKKKFALFLQRKKKADAWMSEDGNKDKEIDSGELIGDFGVDDDKLKQVTLMHGKVVEIQKDMLSRVANDKKTKLFDEGDVEREIWSPLVASGAIPANSVADKYSREVQIWQGAVETYEDMLKDYSEQAGKHEKAKKVLQIAGDTVTMLGGVVGGVLQAVSVPDQLTREDKNELSKLNAEKKIADGNNQTLDQKKLDRISELSGKKQALKVAAERKEAAALAVVAFNGGLDMIALGLDADDGKKDGWAVAESVLDTAGKIATKSINMHLTSMKADDTVSPDKLAAFKTTVKVASNSIAAALAGTKIGFRAKELYDAPEANKGLAQKIIDMVADTTGSTIAAADPKLATLGSQISMGIKKAGDAGALIKTIHDSRKNGGKPNLGALAGALGVAAIGGIMAGCLPVIADKSRKDSDIKGGDKVGVFQETEDEKKLRVFADKKLMEQGFATVNLSKDILSQFPVDKEASDIQASIQTKLDEAAEEARKEEEEEKKKEISKFNEMLKDKDKLDSVKEQIKLDTGRAEQEIEDLINEAAGVTDEDAAASLEAAEKSIEKLMKQVEACNAKWAFYEKMAKGGASVLVAALPAAGLGAALIKMAADIAVLIRKSQQLNTWNQNIALTLGNGHELTPAIKGRLNSARVQVSLQSARVVFDAIGVTSESLKLADITGAATAVSAANTMASALTEYGFKMHKEIEIKRGWQLYQAARENPSNRKVARKAMKVNSTLSKCVLAYGIVMKGDAISDQVARSVGLTPDLVADQKKVVKKVVKYFEACYSDDPVVMKQVPLEKEWHPGTPVLEASSWTRFKAAASDPSKCSPPLDPKDTDTPLIDTYLQSIDQLRGSDGEYAQARANRRSEGMKDYVAKSDPAVDAAFVDESEFAASPQGGEHLKYMKEYQSAVVGLIKDLKAYSPKTTEKVIHDEMVSIADSMIAQAAVLRAEIDYDVQSFESAAKSAKEVDQEEDPEQEDLYEDFLGLDTMTQDDPSDKKEELVDENI